MTSISLATLARRAADLGNPLPCSDDTQLWFSEHPADLELAKAMCETCPLRRACLAGGIDPAEPFGVWGGGMFQKGRVNPHKAARRPPGRRGRRDPPSATRPTDTSCTPAPLPASVGCPRWI